MKQTYGHLMIVKHDEYCVNVYARARDPETRSLRHAIENI